MIIHWDYILGIPRRFEYCSQVFGIFCNGEEIYSPKQVDTKDCEVQTSDYNRCLIGESYQIFDVPANPDELLLIEV